MFRHKVPAIKVARDRLLDLPVEQARTGALVLGGLRRACELADTLDSCITEDMTFAKHFFNELATLPHDDESHWMNLLEDLALIFRAKRLAFPDLPEEGETSPRTFVALNLSMFGSGGASVRNNCGLLRFLV